jgi:hypothetical protein
MAYSICKVEKYVCKYSRYLGRLVKRFLERSSDLSLLQEVSSTLGHVSRLFPARDRTSSLHIS